MNILIINVDHQPQFTGGIKKVSSVLAEEWRRMGIGVRFVALCNSSVRYGDIAGVEQVFLPNAVDAQSAENVAFLIDQISAFHADIIYNPHIEERGATDLCIVVRQKTNVRLVSQYHFSPTTFIDEKDAYHNHKSIFMPGGAKAFLSRLKWNVRDRRREKKATSSWFEHVSKNSDRIVLLSKYYIPVWQKMSGCTDGVVAVNNPISQLGKMVDMSEKENIVVWCGRVGLGFKRTDYMLVVWKKVARLHPDWRCVIMGSGDVDHWRKLAEERGVDNVEFTGFCNPQQWYQRAKIFCLTSSSEGWGLVLLEAMSEGCVPIAFDSFLSLPEIVLDNVNGVVIPSFDTDAYASDLSLLMDDECKRMRLLQGEKHFDRFLPSAIARQWLDLFTNILNS